MALDFLPFQEGQVITAADLNALVAAIQDGTIFTNNAFISGQLYSMGARITAVESAVVHLESLQNTLAIREQFELSNGQLIVNLSKTPILDTEILILRGVGLSKTGVPAGFVGDYTISGSTITFNTELAALILSGDLLVVQYRYEV